MHQQSRHPARVSSPASSPQTNPTRTNNQRDAVGSASRVRADSELGAQVASAAPDSGDGSDTGPSKESIKKLDQIIQNFYYKAAVLILQSRLNLTPDGGKNAGRPNKWFQIDTDDISEFRDELRVYKTSGSFENRPPPMIIETYLDASRLSNNQSLVVVDEYGKRWDVLEALNSSESSSDDGSKRKPRQQQKRNTEIILERWRVELKCIPSDQDEFGPSLPTIYKRSIVFFRSLFVATRIMPCWKYSQQALAKSIHPALEVKCRVLMAEPEHSGFDPLRQPFYDGRDVVTDYVFGDLEVPVGRFYASVTYRNDCNFRVDDAESLLSSRFMGVDENFFKPSISQRRDHQRSDSYAEVGSLPANRHGRGAQEPLQTYGSLSTFHGAGALGTSPISALKAVRPIGSDTSSPTGSQATSLEQTDPPNSLPIRRPSLRSHDGSGRRQSVSFHPFKAGSLSGSPRVPDLDQPPSPQSLTRPSTLSSFTHGRTRSSLTAGMAASLRGGPAAVPIDVPPVSASPRPTSRYSSSFTHRRSRPSFGGHSKGDDDQGSSGKQSLSSSAQPGSGLLAEAGGAASSGSFATDDDNISEFLKVLESRKTLQSFEPNKKGESSAAKRTAAQLSKFQLMRESNNVLTESMTSSTHLHRSSSSSSRQLTNVPSMMNPASISAGSSPGKPLSPHTPHTPAIPSRLSENSIIDYQGGVPPTRRQPRNPAVISTEEEGDDETPVSQEGAIDIPLSPRLLHTTNNNRRASSVAQQDRALTGEDDSDIVQRSISLGAEDREAPTMSTLLAFQRGSGDNSSESLSLQPAADIRASGPSSPLAERDGKGGPSSPGLLSGTPYRTRYTPRGRPTPPHSSRGSFSGGRYSRASGEEGADDEPLLFAMSELERPSRRSLEEARGGGNVGGGGGSSGHSERNPNAFEARGTSRRGW
ncbi:autophagy-related protein 13-domain-containing protein [Lasiosphaeria ovina]|uniref:Autophagy-related protein 13 n=1 Tax=Lasiosphaeria ovina TaxID=92902 RepID=A0AAE0NN85_9PEZI|nr:autophagy-related protein 13-domain-containing protein [Lasiosphaeria ovina]